MRDLVNSHIDVFCDHFDLVYYWKACMEALAGDIDKAFASLEAILDRGLCIPGNQLIEDPDFSGMRGTQRYNAIVSLNDICRKKRIDLLSPKLRMPAILHEDSEYAIYYLHGNTRSGLLEHQVFADMRSITDTMYFPDAPEQNFLKYSYLWDDEDTAYQYVTGIIGEHKKRSNKKIILAGFSRGARTALKIVYEKGYAVDGIIAYAPAAPVKDIESWDFLMNTIKVPAEIIVGEKDEVSLEDCEKLAALLAKGNIPVRLTLIEGGQHEYPCCFENYFTDALNRLKSVIS